MDCPLNITFFAPSLKASYKFYHDLVHELQAPETVNLCKTTLNQNVFLVENFLLDLCLFKGKEESNIMQDFKHQTQISSICKKMKQKSNNIRDTNQKFIFLRALGALNLDIPPPTKKLFIYICLSNTQFSAIFFKILNRPRNCFR